MTHSGSSIRAIHRVWPRQWFLSSWCSVVDELCMSVEHPILCGKKTWRHQYDNRLGGVWSGNM